MFGRSAKACETGAVAKSGRIKNVFVIVRSMRSYSLSCFDHWVGDGSLLMNIAQRSRKASHEDLYEQERTGATEQALLVYSVRSCSEGRGVNLTNRCREVSRKVNSSEIRGIRKRKRMPLTYRKAIWGHVLGAPNRAGEVSGSSNGRPLQGYPIRNSAHWPVGRLCCRNHVADL
jgi:hypothetical protein